MKHIVAALSSGLLLLAGCADSETAGRSVCAGTPPVAWLARRIAGNRITVKAMLPDGRSPHDYSPSPRDIASLGSSKCLLSTGLPFEKWLEKAAGEKTRDVTSGVRRIPLDHHHHHHHHGEDDHGEEHSDPHIWLSVDNDIVIARNIAAILSREFPDERGIFAGNLAGLEKDLLALRDAVKSGTGGCEGRDFFVYHAAFGYFADMTGTRQHAVELGGREPSAEKIASVVSEMKSSKATVLIVQPQFSPASAAALAAMTGARIVEIDPMEGDVISCIGKLADAIAGSDAR